MDLCVFQRIYRYLDNVLSLAWHKSLRELNVMESTFWPTIFIAPTLYRFATVKKNLLLVLSTLSHHTYRYALWVQMPIHYFPYIFYSCLLMIQVYTLCINVQCHKISSLFNFYFYCVCVQIALHRNYTLIYLKLFSHFDCYDLVIAHPNFFSGVSWQCSQNFKLNTLFNR